MIGSDPAVFIELPGVNSPVALVGCGDLLPVVRSVLNHWGCTVSSAPTEVEPVIKIHAEEKGYIRTSPWRQDAPVFRDPVDVACDLVADLAHAYIDDNPGTLCLHCAAVRFARGLVVFPSTYRAGKSTLAVHLAALGAQVFADDILPVTGDDRGMALGILPRLRIPLPETSDPILRDFVDAHSGPANRRYLYVDLPENSRAPFGTEAPIIGVVLLERSEGCEPALTETSGSDALKGTVLRNFARGNPGLEIIDRLFGIINAAECLRLRFDRGTDAVSLLAERFGLQDNP